MKRNWSIFCLLFISVALSVFSTGALYLEHRWQETKVISRLVYLPPNGLKAVSLEFSGLLSDYLMLKTMVFMGEKLQEKKYHSKAEWNMINAILVQITTLDSRFWDPYLLAEVSFPWDAGMVEEANQLLLKAAEARPEDYRPNFFLWFNHYYFMKDPRTAAPFLEQAARIPGSPKYYKTLAARMRLYGGETRNGILFLDEMIKETQDSAIRDFLQLRRDALSAIAFLEDKVRQYTRSFHVPPKTLDQLVEKGIIKEIPSDPYGGKFYITEGGHIYSTSNLVKQKTNQ